MRVETTIKYIPAQEIPSTKYIARDGKEFGTEKSCKEYEKRLDIMEHPVIKNSISGLYSLDEEYRITLYHITSKEDYDFLISSKWISPYNLKTDFNKYGPGWYVYYTVDGGDYADVDYLMNYKHLVEEEKQRIERWENEINDEIGKRSNNA